MKNLVCKKSFYVKTNCGPKINRFSSRIGLSIKTTNLIHKTIPQLITCTLVVLNFVVLVLANMKQTINVTTNLFITLQLMWS